MTAQPLSKRAKFHNAIVLSAEWSNMAGIGECELAVVLGPRSAQLWHWIDEYGSAERMQVGRLSSWRDAVDALASSEEGSACIVPDKVRVAGTPRYIGQIVAMAWCDSEDDKQAARILCRFPDASLSALDAKRNGIFDAKLQQALANVLARLDEAGFELDDMPDRLEMSQATPAALDAAINRILGEHRRLEERAEREQQRREDLLRPWRLRLDDIEQRWRMRSPPRRYPGGGSLPPVGLRQLIDFAEKHVLEHGALPTGVHTISGHPNPMAGVVAALTVNFDELGASDTPFTPDASA